jgi:uncharacterized protein
MLRRDKRGPFCRKQLLLSIDTESRTIENRYNAPHFRLSASAPDCRFNPMKLHATSTQQYQTVTAYDESGVEINAVHYRKSLVVMPEMPAVDWPVASFDALTAEDFARIDALSPDVVILGTGARQRFIHPRLIASLNARRVGVETMDNQAACRTYNILMAEGRKVALALILDTPQG